MLKIINIGAIKYPEKFSSIQCPLNNMHIFVRAIFTNEKNSLTMMPTLPFKYYGGCGKNYKAKMGKL